MKSKLTLLVISLILGGILGEIILRQFSFLKTYSERNGGPFQTYYDLKLPSWYLTLNPTTTVERKTSEFDYSFISNSQGFRNDEISEKQDSVFRIIALGDSYTEGVGSDENQKTWPKYLEAGLNRSMKEKFEVINAGVSGSDPFHEFILLRDKLLRFQPNLVIIAINNSDIDDYIFRGGMERFGIDGTVQYKKAPPIHPFYQYSFLFRLTTHSVLGYDKTFTKYKDRGNVNTIACLEIGKVLLKMDSLCAKNNSQLLVVIHGRGGEMKKKRNRPHFVEKIKPFRPNIGEVKKIPGLLILDTRNRFEYSVDEHALKELVWNQDKHFTAKGYERMAQIICDSLEQYEIKGKSRKSIEKI